MLKLLIFYTRMAMLAFLLLTGCSAAQYRQQTDATAQKIIADKQRLALGQSESFMLEATADILRHRLLIDQQLPMAGPASLGSSNLQPVAHWPEAAENPLEGAVTEAEPVATELSLSLVDALKVAAGNSREYQSRKEDLFRNALALDFERNAFRSTFAGTIDGNYSQDRSGSLVEGGSTSVIGRLTKLFTSGVSLTTRIGWDLVRMLQPGRDSSSGLFADASVTIPLLRGAGRHIAAERSGNSNATKKSSPSIWSTAILPCCNRMIYYATRQKTTAG